MATAAQIERAVADFTKEVRPAFFAQYIEKERRLLGKLRGGKVLTTLPSDRQVEKYPRFRATPQLVEYEEGNLKFTGFGHDSFSVPNRLFGRGIAIPRTVWDDMATNPAARSAWLQKVSGMSVRAVNFLHKLLADFILGSGFFSTTQTGMDALAMFSNSHPEGRNLVDNDDGATTGTTQANLQTDHNAVMDTWTAMTDPEGEDILREEAPDRLTVLVDPQLLNAYAQFFRAQMVPGINSDGTITGVGALSNVMSPANAAQLQGVDGLGKEVTLIGWARLRNQNTTIYVDASEELPGLTPIFHQQRDAPELDVIGPGSEQWKIHEQALYKVRMRGNLAIGDYTKIIKVDKSGS